VSLEQYHVYLRLLEEYTAAPQAGAGQTR
jgi:hypothetical protein